jgi:hypothetical protein
MQRWREYAQCTVHKTNPLKKLQIPRVRAGCGGKVEGERERREREASNWICGYYDAIQPFDGEYYVMLCGLKFESLNL